MLWQTLDQSVWTAGYAPAPFDTPWLLPWANKLSAQTVIARPTDLSYFPSIMRGEKIMIILKLHQILRKAKKSKPQQEEEPELCRHISLSALITVDMHELIRNKARKAQTMTPHCQLGLHLISVPGRNSQQFIGCSLSMLSDMHSKLTSLTVYVLLFCRDFQRCFSVLIIAN